MIHCDQCGCELPDHASFCLQCGAPVKPVPAVSPPPVRVVLDFVQPALAGGLALGILSSIPIISLANCLCCMWIVGGGALAALLLAKQNPTGVVYGDGAFVGVLSGLFGAIIATVLSIPLRLIAAHTFESQKQAMEEALKEAPRLDAPLRELLIRLASPEISGLTILVTFFMNLLLFSLFAMIGGILAIAIINRKS